tara:strand:- start:827 stop:1042 length:216 start_codon:yes stop_codon:yes gene_type:complete
MKMKKLVKLLQQEIRREFEEGYNIKAQSCTQSDGDKGKYVMYYTDKKGKKRSNCHTSKQKAKDQIAAIEAP